MKYLILSILALGFTSCCTPCRQAMKPNHLGVTPSLEFEIQKGQEIKVKPKIQTTVDWNF